ncbi:hypothetical protein [Lyngbya confervoides]|uniref:Uncharacterized protein n=1 Tax=Lyngbya confervoides BDU141951 TaxID=1574623 RepID=A0ABD4SX85_9CYAN|nr:hypothetical protein [Lyngbya confervoides]MCM1981249.1 hypothetical protein [Lyngbya confervoides BDU141951]
MLLKFKDLEGKVEAQKAQGAMAEGRSKTIPRAFLEMDDEWIEKMERAELNWFLGEWSICDGGE